MPVARTRRAEIIENKRDASPEDRRAFEARFGLPAGASSAYRLYASGPPDDPGKLAFLVDVCDGKGETLGVWQLGKSGNIGRNGLILPTLSEAQLSNDASPIVSPASWPEAMLLTAMGFTVAGRSNDSVKSKQFLSSWMTANRFRRRGGFRFGNVTEFRRMSRPLVTFDEGAAVYFARMIPRQLWPASQALPTQPQPQPPRASQ